MRVLVFHCRQYPAEQMLDPSVEPSTMKNQPPAEQVSFPPEFAIDDRAAGQQGVYEAPRIELVLGPDALQRELLYAGIPGVSLPPP